MAENHSSFERHAQTALVLLVVALLGWVGLTTHNTSLAVAQMAIEVQHLKSEVQKPADKFDEIERRLDAIERALGVHMRETRK